LQVYVYENVVNQNIHIIAAGTVIRKVTEIDTTLNN